LLSSLERQDQIILSIDPKEQWVKEATAWFETAFLKARYSEFHLLQIGLAPPDIPEGVFITPENREIFAEICNRILFFDGNYSNIDFIQLMIIVSCLMVPWLISFRHPIAAGTSKIGKLCWSLVKQIIARVCTSALRCMSLIKNAFRPARPVSGRFPYSSYWSRPENRRSHVELDFITPGNTLGLERNVAVEPDISQPASQARHV
jgi:hypothetical protein